MISICCCSINSKWEVEMLFKTLKARNPETKFEFIVTLDDRVTDGSSQLFESLSKQHKEFKYIIHTEEDTIEYMSRALRYYKKIDLFPETLLNEMRNNLSEYAAGKFVDRTKGFLWQSSGVLYNRAVDASTGDVIIVTPGDFIYLFSLDQIEKHVKNHSENGHFYASLPALWARVTNMDKGWLSQHVKDVHDGKIKASPHRWDSREVFRDYLRYPPKIEDFVVPDFYHSRLIPLSSPKANKQLEKFCTQVSQGGMKYNPHFHGFHVMTRDTFDSIGGFTEEWIHRAFPDDRMTRLGMKHNGQRVPASFSVAWCGTGELLSGHGPGYSPGWNKLLPEIDPYYNQHPIPPNGTKAYLYSGVARKDYIHNRIVENLGLDAPIKRLFTGSK